MCFDGCSGDIEFTVSSGTDRSQSSAPEYVYLYWKGSVER